MKIVDLSLTLSNEVTPPQGHPHAEVTSFKSHATDGVAVSIITFSLHTGTHVDAPYHFIPGATKIEQMDLSKLIGPAMLLDLRNRVAPQQAITVEDLYIGGWSQNVRGKIIVLFSGWAEQNWNKQNYYTENPYLSEDAANFIAGSGILALAVDFPVDGCSSFPVHRIVLGAGIPQIENLIHLDQLPRDFMLAAIPLKIQNAEAGPARVVAFIDEKSPISDCSHEFVNY